MSGINLERAGGTAILTVDSPEVKNGLTPQMGRDLVAACEEIDADPAIGAATQHAPPAATVDADHHGGLCVGVLRTGLGSGPRPLTGSDFDVGFVVVAVVARPQTLDSRSASIRAHSWGNSGSVLLVAPTSSIWTSATRNPTIAPAIAIR